jgi:hypothetical protein
MKPNRPIVPDCVRQYFIQQLSYCYLGEELPEFGGIIIYLRTKGGCEHAAYYLPKRSQFDLVFSDELRLALDFLGGTDIPLRFAVTNSDFTQGAHLLADREGIDLLGPGEGYTTFSRKD